MGESQLWMGVISMKILQLLAFVALMSATAMPSFAQEQGRSHPPSTSPGFYGPGFSGPGLAGPGSSARISAIWTGPAGSSKSTRVCRSGGRHQAADAEGRAGGARTDAYIPERRAVREFVDNSALACRDSERQRRNIDRADSTINRFLTTSAKPYATTWK
jgi:hypothetical protein